MSRVDEQRAPPTIADFEGDPPRSLAAWRWLWSSDTAFPVRSHRGGIVGRVLVWLKRLLRPLVKAPQNDLWQRQRVFNLILLERLQALEDRASELDGRLAAAEEKLRIGFEEIMRHNDGLFSRVDQKLDLYRREAKDQTSALRSALAMVEEPVARPAAPTRALAEAERAARYVEFENRYRGSGDDIARRLERYNPWLESRSPVLDLGCGRGEALVALSALGVAARGVDPSVEMVRHCRELGLEASQQDALTALREQTPDSLGAVVSFHVVEHLAAEDVDLIIDLSFRALRPGGLLLLETPNPRSLVVGASNFWIDPTHRRPVHPESLRARCQGAGFDSVEVLSLHPFEPDKRLPETAVQVADGGLEGDEARVLAQRLDRLRDRLDDLLYGDQDYAVLAVK